LNTLKWNKAEPFISDWVIDSNSIDHYQHTNNVAYLSRLEKLAWQHSNALGLSILDYQQADRAMVITKHELMYHLPSHLGDTLACATWIVFCDNKFRLRREFQFINTASKKTVFTANTDFVCVSLSSGAPKKMPAQFYNVYGGAISKETSHV